MSNGTLDAGQLLDALFGHYVKPGEDRNGEILLTEVVAPGTNRRCDLLRLGLWASRGLGIDVHEIKTNRPDWLRELGAPAKAEAWWRYCARFWITAPAGVVRPQELPPGWGLLEPPAQERHRRFRVIVQAATKEPQITVGLLTAIFGRLENMRLREIQRIRDEFDTEMYRAVEKVRAEHERRGLPSAIQERLNLLEKLEAAIGLTLDNYAFPGGRTISEMTPAELAAVLADATQNVTAQQRMRLLDDRTRQLLNAARYLIDAAEKPLPAPEAVAQP